MSAISDVTENAILDLVFRATAWAGYAEDATSSPETSIAVALHTADPIDSGNMSSSEADYASYVRQSTLRSTGWTAALGGSTNLAAALDFPASGGAGNDLTHFSVGKSGGGAAAILWYGTLSPTIPIGGSGVVPRLTTATAITIA